MSKTSVFFTGATGYLGAATLQLLLPEPSLSITVLVRSKEKATKLEQFGLAVVLGSLDDAALMESEGAKADVVIQSASHVHIDGVSALLKGAKKHFEQTGKQSVFIQTSGTGAFAKLDAMGLYTSEHALSDMDPDLFSHRNKASHNVVTEALVAADAEGYVKAYIVYPSLVYGVLKGPLVDAGIAHAYSIAIPALIKLSIHRGQGAMTGKGVNRWPAVHIDDTADFYKLLLERTLSNDASHGPQGHYVLENGELSLGEAARRYTAILHARGKSAKAEPDTFTAAEIEKSPMLSFLGTDVRVVGDRPRQLGWSPAHGIADFYESIQEDVEAILAGSVEK